MKLEDMLYRVRPQVIGCPEPVAINALRAACEELCRETHVWQAKLDPVSIYSGIGSYRLPVPAYARIVTPLRVDVGDRKLEHRHAHELDEEKEHWREWAGPHPLYWTMETPQDVVIVPYPEADKTDALVARASMEPAEDTVDLPGWFHQYDRCLKEGALAELMEMPNQPWSSPKMAQAHRRRFAVEVSKVRYDVSRGFTDQPIRTKAQPR